MILEFIIFLVGFLLGSIIIWFVRQKEFDSFKQNQEELKKNFSDLSNEALLNNQKSFLELAENKFSSLLDNSEDQLDKKKELIDSSLKEMKERLKSLSENTVALKSQMEESRKTVGDLSDTTLRLRQILSSNQARGQWGERMVEDILNFIGLTEGINFKQQTQQDSSRPDFTFFLPDDKVINMDVKFPLNHYENYVNAESESEKELEKKAFIKDVRNRIKEVSDLKKPSLSASKIPTKAHSGISRPSLRRFIPTNTSNTPSLRSLIISIRSKVSMSECMYLTLIPFS